MLRLKLQSLQNSSYPLPKPVKQYETVLVWSGQTCYDTVLRKGRQYVTINGEMHMKEVEYPLMLSSIEHTEAVTAVIYSFSPLIWSEDDDLFIELERPVND
jgi:hypothetical protein